MKRKLITALLASMLCLTGWAQGYTLEVSGTVTMPLNGVIYPIANHEVNILIDSVAGGFSYQNTVLTDDQGNFYDMIGIPAYVYQGMVYLSTYDSCLGYYQNEAIAFSQNSGGVAAYFIICNFILPDCFAYYYYYADSSGYLTYQFMDASVGEIDTWSWDFGDGVIINEQNPVHTFPAEGVYYVCLTISNATNTCYNTYCEYVYVYENPGGGNGCDNYFLYYNGGTDPNTYTFEGYLYNYPQALLYEWDFGDGTYGTGQIVTHTFQGNPNGMDTYLTCLWTLVYDSIGDSCRSVSCQEIWVNTQPGCQASFWYYPDSLNDLTIHFNDMSYNWNGYPPDTWYWSFGDSTFSTEQNPTHTYLTEGVYSICLTITADSNCTSSWCEEVWVGMMPPDCQNWFWYEQTDTLTFTFNGEVYWGGTINPEGTEFYWEFGDGITGTGQTVTHTFLSNNVDFYTVCLQTYSAMPDGDSCSAFSCQDVWLNTNPGGDCVSWFDYSANELTIDFTGYSMSQLSTEYTWEFGDGTSGTGQQVQHTYGGPGIYMVMLTTTDSGYCFWQSMAEVYVGNATFPVYGTVYLANTQSADQADVTLMILDSLGMGLIDIQTVSTNNSGFFQFDSLPLYNYCLYFLQAELTEGSNWYGEYLPTYYVNALNWQEATPVLPLNNWPFDIYMVPAAAYNSGPGSIAGSVNALGTRGYMEGIEIMLMNSQNQAITYVRSNENGEFSFSGLAYGTYIVYAEMIGIQTNPATVTLSEGQESVELEIQVAGGEANYVVFGISEHKQNLDKVGNIYPNPVTNRSKIEMVVKESAIFNVVIYNLMGQPVEEQIYRLGIGAHTLTLNTTALQPGVYTLRISSAQGDYIARRIIKL